MSAAALVAGESTISDGADTFEGEHVLFRAALSEGWQAHRAWEGCCFGTWLGCSITALPIFGLPYLWCGQSLRRAEAETFSLILTTSAIHFHQKRYDCAWCFQTTTSKTIPLDKIQDVMLVSNCVGDCCEFSAKGKPWQIHIQTAGFSGGAGKEGMRPELLVFCIENPEAFRSSVMAAKRALLGAALPGLVGAGKDSNPMTVISPAAGAASLRAGGGGADSTAVLAVLERIEKAVNEGVARLPPARA